MESRSLVHRWAATTWLTELPQQGPRTATGDVSMAPLMALKTGCLGKMWRKRTFLYESWWNLWDIHGKFGQTRYYMILPISIRMMHIQVAMFFDVPAEIAARFGIRKIGSTRATWLWSSLCHPKLMGWRSSRRILVEDPLPCGNSRKGIGCVMVSKNRCYT